MELIAELFTAFKTVFLCLQCTVKENEEKMIERRNWMERKLRRSDERGDDDGGRREKNE